MNPQFHDDPEARLAALGFELPAAPKPVAAYIPAVRTGNLLFISGQVPFRDGKLVAQGAVPSTVDMETAKRCAVQCALNGLAVAKASVGSLSKIRRVVRLGCFICSDPGFTDQPKVANGASDLLVQIFGEAGRHARAAVGSVSLPLGAPVEIEMVLEVAD